MPFKLLHSYATGRIKQNVIFLVVGGRSGSNKVKDNVAFIKSTYMSE